MPTTALYCSIISSVALQRDDRMESNDTSCQPNFDVEQIQRKNYLTMVQSVLCFGLLLRLSLLASLLLLRVLLLLFFHHHHHYRFVTFLPLVVVFHAFFVILPPSSPRTPPRALPVSVPRSSLPPPVPPPPPPPLEVLPEMKMMWKTWSLFRFRRKTWVHLKS